MPSTMSLVWTQYVGRLEDGLEVGLVIGNRPTGTSMDAVFAKMVGLTSKIKVTRVYSFPR